MNSDEIKSLVKKSENAAVEFKRARGGLPADFWTSYSAFANTDGDMIRFSSGSIGEPERVINMMIDEKEFDLYSQT